MRKYLVARMRQINRQADTASNIFTAVNFRRVWFELMINSVAYNTFMQASWLGRASRMKTQLVQECSSLTGNDMTKCTLVYTRTQVARFMSLRGKALPQFEWMSGQMVFRSKPTRAEAVLEERSKVKSGLNIV
jgi:hypothetical protein